jgi:hypothetical protein
MRAAIAALTMAALCATAGRVAVLDHDLDIPVGQYRYVAVPVQQPQAEGARLTGELEVEPDTLKLELLLVWEYQLPAWAGTQEGVDTLYYSRMGSGEVDIPLDEGFGRYALIISNRGNYAPASVHGTLQMEFEGEGRMYDPLATALYLALALMAIGGIVSLVVVAVRSLKKNK